MIKQGIFLFSTLTLLSFSTLARESKADLEAIQLLGEDMTAWWDKQPKNKQLSISVLSVETDISLNSNVAGIVEDTVLAAFSRARNTKAIVCFECRAPQIVKKDDRLIVTKGIPNHDTLRALAKKLELDSFATVFVTKTAFALRALVSVYSAADGALYNAQVFEVQNFSLDDVSMQFSVATGLRWDLAISRNAPLNAPIPLAIELSWLQGIGRYARVGLMGGGTLLGHSGNLAYLAPKLAWKFSIARSPIAFSPSFHTGAGVRFATTVAGAIPTKTSFGILAGIALDLNLGHFFFFGARADAYLPLDDKNFSDITFYPGFNIGMTIGR